MRRLTLSIDPAARRNVFGAFMTFFVVLAGHVLMETARDALFLSRLPAEHLPWMYLLIAVFALMLAGAAVQWGRRGVAGWLWISAAITAGFWGLSWTGSDVAVYALYVWTGVFATVAMTQLWVMLSQIFTVTDGKRYYGLIGAGSLLGAIAGAGLASAATVWFEAQHLLLGAAALFAIGGLGPMFAIRPLDGERRAPVAHDLRACLHATFAHPFIRRLGLLIIVATVTLKLADYIFMAHVADTVPKEELGAFFARFYVVLNTLGLLAQLVLTSWLLRRIGVHRAVLVLPFVMAGVTVGLLVGGGLMMAMALRGADGTFKHSVHRTAIEVLWLPVPDRLRRHAKFFVSAAGERGAQAVASLAILGVIALGGDAAALAWLALALGVVWIAVGLSLEPHYVDLFRATLREGTIETRTEFPELDLSSLEALIRALSSPEDAEVLGALRLLAQEGRADLIPALVLHHPSEEVVLGALEIFTEAGRHDFVALATRLAERGSPPIRAAAIAAIAASRPDIDVLRAATEDPEPLVRATALAELIALQKIPRADEDAAIQKLLEETPGIAGRRAVLRAIARRPHPDLYPLIEAFGSDIRAEVRAEVAVTMGSARDPAFLPALTDMLGHRATRAAARAALVQYGKPAFDHLTRALTERTVPYETLRHLPRTISRFDPTLAAPFLLDHLLVEPRGMVRYKILRGLGRIVVDHPAVTLDRRLLKHAIDRALKSAWRLTKIADVLASPAEDAPEREMPGHELLTALVRDKRTHTIERLFRLLGLAYPSENFERIYRGLSRGSRRTAASSLELLEHRLAPRIRQAVIGLVGELLPFDRDRVLDTWAPVLPDTYAGVVAHLAADDGGTTQDIAAYHAAELGLPGTRDRLVALAEAATTPRTGGVLQSAWALIERATARTAHAE